MTQPAKHVVFDVVGTCVSFDAFFDRIDEVLGKRLREHTVTAKHFGYTWQTAAELEFTFLSVAESYKPYKDVLRGLFYRTLGLCGIEDPRSLATEEERDQCIQGYSDLQIRPGCREAFQLLRDNGFTVWCFTTGDVQRVKGYFDRAGIDMPTKNFVSCDNVGVAKPSLAAYRHVWAKLGENDVKWFAAAHMWDVTAATKVGFRGAWSAVLEKEDSSSDIFNHAKMEVLAGSLEDMAQQIIDKSR